MSRINHSNPPQHFLSPQHLRNWLTQKINDLAFGNFDTDKTIPLIHILANRYVHSKERGYFSRVTVSPVTSIFSISGASGNRRDHGKFSKSQ
jgi:hypothetical protein